jgi:hypothetical protein|tara:strand:- start:507 stop:614 length:108 start_codon:yes stop_codon:yes gene_type:complete
MDILIPLIIVTVVLAWSVKKFKPELWNKITAKFKK